MIAEIIIVLVVFIIVISAAVFVFRKGKEVDSNPSKKEGDSKGKMYEVAVLNDLGDRMGYSINVQNVIEIIIGSLRQFIDYSAVSYMLLDQEKIVFKSYLEKPVSRKFIDYVRARMLDSISVILNADYTNVKIEETLWGAGLNGQSDGPVGSFFNIPLVIGGKLAGLLTVAATEQNFYKEEEMLVLYKTARQSAEAVTRLQGVVELEKSKLNSMVSSMTEGVIMTDTDYKIIVVNPAARKAVGFENKETPSVADFAGVLAGKIDLKDKIEESIRLDKVFYSEEISLPAGFYKIIVSPVKNNWKTLGCVAVFRDITKEKEVEKIKEEFTSMIVHELRSPLDSIKKIIELMRGTKVDKKRQAECFQMIYGSSSDMLELINNLLDVAKIEAGKFELIKQPSDIKKTVESRVLFFDIAAKDAKVKLSSRFGKDVPDNVEFDAHTISQVLNNLISNALKFNKENGSVIVQAILHKKDGSVEREAKDAGITWFLKKGIPDIQDSLLVAVTNTGAGIAPDQINKLFNKFFQVKSVFAEKGGTGLGLAITKSIVESHGGVVGVESIEGQGATFFFTLPINSVK